MRIGQFLALMSLCLVTSGCAPLLTEMIVSAPNRWNPLVGNPDLMPPPPETLATDKHFYVNVGPPEALLSVSVMEPKTGEKTAKGTILVVHGIRNRGFWMMGTAKML